jgi:Zn-dependent protease
MPLFRSGSLWLFRLFGIDVYVHWSWLLMALFQVQFRARNAREDSWLLPIYETGKWYALQYLALFGIVLLHELGHALACRKVGGQADTIVLWPLGGIAFVQPPQRPSALLWTAICGPLVNVLLTPVLAVLAFVDIGINGSALSPDLPSFLIALFATNCAVLLFNLIPVYPLDGGQILQGLLWMLIGRAESLMVVSILGMLIGGVLMMIAITFGNVFGFILAGFVMFMASAGFRHSQLLSRLLSGPRRSDVVCPACKTAPLVGNYWTCHECHSRFDIFEQHGRCPVCGQLYRVTKCPDCYQEHPLEDWFSPVTHRTESPLPPIPSPDRASE